MTKLRAFAAFVFTLTGATSAHAQPPPAASASPAPASTSPQDASQPAPAAAPAPTVLPLAPAPTAPAPVPLPAPPAPPPPSAPPSAALVPPPATPTESPQPSSGGVPIPPESAPVILTPSTAPPPSKKEPGFRELRQTPTAKGGPGDPAAVAAGPGGFGLSSRDKQWQIRFRALVQGDGRFWFDDKQRPQTDTFLPRRVQTILEGSLPYGVSFLVYPDFGGGTVTITDAYLGIDLDAALRFRFGKFRPPFGLERLTPTSNLLFVEFGLPTLLTPNRDVGAMVQGDVFGGVLGYAAGIFNGVPDNASGDLDNDSEKEFAGRIYFRPFVTLDAKVFGRTFVGAATTFGRVYGNPSNPALPTYKTPAQATFFSYISASSGTPDYSNTVVANGPHNRYGAFLYEAIGPFGLLAEMYESDQEVGRAGFGNAWVHSHAYQVQGSFVLFGAGASYDFVHVETPVNPKEGHFGALELKGRFARLDVDSAVFPNYASKTGSARGATEVAAGVNWYWSDNAKFVVDWEHTEFRAGAKTPSEIAIGHREAENAILVRAQVVY